MALSCLQNYIYPFYGCNSPTGAPASGLYLTGLPGLNSSLFSDIANADQVTWEGVWNDVQTRALQTFEDDVVEEFQKRYQLRQIIQSVDLGAQYDETILTPNIPGTQNGIIIETLDQNDELAQSNLMLIYLQSISFYFYDAVTASSTLTLTCIDADLETTVFTQSIGTSSGLIQGWNTLTIEQEFTARRLFIFFSGTMTEYVDFNIDNFLLDNFGGINGSNGSWSNYGLMFGGFGKCGCQARINGTQVLNNQYQSFSRTPSTFGTSMVFTLRCSIKNFICNNRDKFKTMFQLKLAMELIDELMYSDRLNAYTGTYKARFKELREVFELQYRGGDTLDRDGAAQGIKFVRREPGKLKQLVTGIILNDYDCCLCTNAPVIAYESRM